MLGTKRNKTFGVTVFILIIAIFIINISFVSGCISEGGISKSDINLRKEAVANKDVSLCEQIEAIPEKYSCFSDIAVETGNPNLCARTANRGNYEKVCYMETAIKANNHTICEKIKFEGEQPYQYDSRDWCFLQIAEKTKNRTLCNKITGKDAKSSCLVFTTSH